MELKEIMTTEEQSAVKQLIAAHLQEQVARLNLDEARADLKQAAKELSNLYFRTEETDDRYHPRQSVGTIPVRFVAYFGNDPYLIEVDEEGDNGHKVNRIAGILTR